MHSQDEGRMAGGLWWQRGVIYQIYPRSFMDSNGDGVGDLRGVLERLDYLKWLGVDALWLSPIYPSPMADFGYDLADYTDIDPLFGNLADFDHLLAEVHRRGLKLLLDFVPNHYSDQHPWFQESRSSATIRRIPTASPATVPMMPCWKSIMPTSPRCIRSSRICARCWTSIQNAC